MAKRVLCIDGGGARGIYAATIIMALEEEYNIKFSEYFDSFYGVSTGSLISTLLYLGYSGKEIYDKYNEYNKEIFSIDSTNDTVERDIDVLRKIVENELEKKNISFYKNNKDLYAMVYNYSKSKAELINLDDGLKKKNESIEYILASCSAPSYFKPLIIENNEYVDGSIYGRSISLIAFNNEIANGEKIENIELLNIGCMLGSLEKTKIKTIIQDFKGKKWIPNFLVEKLENYFEEKIKLVDMCERMLYHSIDSSIQINDNILGAIFKNRGRYLSINFKTDKHLKLEAMDENIFNKAILVFLDDLKRGTYNKFFKVNHGFFQKIYHKLFKKDRIKNEKKEYVFINELNLYKNDEYKAFNEYFKSKSEETLEYISNENIEKATNISKYLGKLKDEFMELINMLRDYYNGDFDIPKEDLIIIVSSIIYVITPLDLIPDILPVAGFTDDISLITVALKKISSTFKRYNEYKSKLNLEDKIIKKRIFMLEKLKKGR